jgi:hypothetical protein
VPERPEQIRPAAKVARTAHQRVVSIDPVKAVVAPARIGLRKEATWSAKRRIDNAVARRAADSRILSAAEEEENVSGAVAVAASAVVAGDDDKRSQLGWWPLLIRASQRKSWWQNRESL